MKRNEIDFIFISFGWGSNEIKSLLSSRKQFCMRIHWTSQLRIHCNASDSGAEWLSQRRRRSSTVHWTRAFNDIVRISWFFCFYIDLLKCSTNLATKIRARIPRKLKQFRNKTHTFALCYMHETRGTHTIPKYCIIIPFGIIITLGWISCNGSGNHIIKLRYATTILFNGPLLLHIAHNTNNSKS